MSLKSELNQKARAAGGAFKTVSDREKIVERFAHCIKSLNIQIHAVRHIKANHVVDYVDSRKADGIGLRTLQNEVAAIRAVLRQAEMYNLANGDKISNRSLGISGATRDGTKVAMPKEKFDEILNKLKEMDLGTAACAVLERQLGLRGEEAVQSCKSLKSWDKQLAKGESIRVIYGTKGGRPRDTRVLDVTKAREAISNALKIAKERGGRLIDKPDLKTAMRRYGYCMAACGATGESAPHSLRYAFACQSIQRYESQGFNHKDALAQTSIDLGHGDGRGRYIEQVYTRR